MFDAHYRINEPDVISEEFDGETVILDLTNGIYFSFRGSGDRVWQQLTAGISPADLFTALDAAGTPLRAEVEAFISGLITAGLLRRDDSLATPDAVIDVTDISQAPVLERFDDLSELILSDPIHESDADRGWPYERIAATPTK